MTGHRDSGCGAERDHPENHDELGSALSIVLVAGDGPYSQHLRGHPVETSSDFQPH